MVGQALTYRLLNRVAQLKKNLLQDSKTKPNKKIILTGGTIGAAKKSGGLVSVDKDSTKKFTEILVKNYPGIEIEQPFFIDSQMLNMKEHLPQIFALLDKDPDTDILLTCGTDTAKWISSAIAAREKEKGNKRRVVIASSMMNQTQEGGKEHISAIINAAFSLLSLSNSDAPKGVYAASAEDIEGERINFFDITNSQDRITKTNALNVGAVVGSNHFCTGYKDRSFSFTNKPKLSAEELWHQAVEDFIVDDLIKKDPPLQFRLCPTLAQSNPESIRKYYSDAKAGDIVFCEIGANWIDDTEKKADYKRMVDELAARGVVVTLCNRNYYSSEDKKFHADLNGDKLQEFRDIFSQDNVIITANYSTARLYSQFCKPLLSAEETTAYVEAAAERESSSKTFDPAAQFGIRYVPDAEIYSNSYEKICKEGFKLCTTEALAGGVIPDTVRKKMEIVASKYSEIPSMTLAPTYEESRKPDIAYAASASDDGLLSVNAYRTSHSAKGSLLEKPRTKVTELIEAMNRLYRSRM